MMVIKIVLGRITFNIVSAYAPEVVEQGQKALQGGVGLGCEKYPSNRNYYEEEI